MRHFNYKLTKSEELELCYLYKNTNISNQELSFLFKVSSTNISKIIKRNGFMCNKPGGRLHFCNENYFEKIDTFDKSYFLGLIMADGNIFKNYLKIALQENDSYILEKLIMYINYTGSLYIRKRKKYNINHKDQKLFEICSSKVCNDLKLFNIIPNKSHFTKFPNIPENLYSHFIRGYFDGDGCITKNNKGSLQFNICGNKDLILKIQDILIHECILNKTKCDIKNNWFYNLKYGGNKQVKRIYEYLYKDCEDLYLTRKKEKFENFFNNLKLINLKCECGLTNRNPCKYCYGRNYYKQNICK